MGVGQCVCVCVCLNYSTQSSLHIPKHGDPPNNEPLASQHSVPANAWSKRSVGRTDCHHSKKPSRFIIEFLHEFPKKGCDLILTGSLWFPGFIWSSSSLVSTKVLLLTSLSHCESFCFTVGICGLCAQREQPMNGHNTTKNWTSNQTQRQKGIEILECRVKKFKSNRNRS